MWCTRRGRREQAECEILTLAGVWAVSHEVEGPRRQEGVGEFPDAPLEPVDPHTTTEAEIEADDVRTPVARVA